MEQWISDPPLLWLLALVGFALIEALTDNLRTLWLSLGAAGGLIASLLGAPLGVQAAVFAIAGGGLLALTHPMVCRLKAAFPGTVDLPEWEDVQRPEG